MKSIKLSTLLTILVSIALGLALLKWALLPIANTYDPSGKAASILTFATPAIATVYALHLVVRDTTSKKNGDDDAA